MALSSNFYKELFKKEKYWTELAQKGLLNIYYLDGKDGIKKFYEIKKAELEEELSLNQNPILSNFLSIINDILAKIDKMSSDYRNGKEVDILSLTTMFLANQMDNSLGLSNEEESSMTTFDLLNLRKQVLNSIRDVYANKEKPCEDPYDDFEFPDDEVVRKKAA